MLRLVYLVRLSSSSAMPKDIMASIHKGKLWVTWPALFHASKVVLPVPPHLLVLDALHLQMHKTFLDITRKKETAYILCRSKVRIHLQKNMQGAAVEPIMHEPLAKHMCQSAADKHFTQ